MSRRYRAKADGVGVSPPYRFHRVLSVSVGEKSYGAASGDVDRFRARMLLCMREKYNER